jgi:hypothetical protein
MSYYHVNFLSRFSLNIGVKDHKKNKITQSSYSRIGTSFKKMGSI